MCGPCLETRATKFDILTEDIFLRLPIATENVTHCDFLFCLLYTFSEIDYACDVSTSLYWTINCSRSATSQNALKYTAPSSVILLNFKVKVSK